MHYDFTICLFVNLYFEAGVGNGEQTDAFTQLFGEFFRRCQAAGAEPVPVRTQGFKVSFRRSFQIFNPLTQIGVGVDLGLPLGEKLQQFTDCFGFVLVQQTVDGVQPFLDGFQARRVWIHVLAEVTQRR